MSKVDVLGTTERIDEKIHQLEQARSMIRKAAQRKADAIGAYRKEVAKTIMRLRQGETFTIDGVEFSETSASNVAKVAEGICYLEKIEEDLADSLYKNVVKGMDALKAELNGLQTKLRYIAD